MALTGTLADAQLDELATLLQQQTRTGRLTLSFPDGHVAIEFRDGKICHVDDERRAPDHRLGELLVAGGCIERTELANALEDQRLSDKPLGTLLVGRGALGTADLHRYLDLQFRESLYPLFGETGGAFEFDPTPVPPRPCAPPPIVVDGLLMDAARRIDELPDILAVVPSIEIRVRRLRETLLLPSDSPYEGRFGEAEGRVFLAIEGRATVGDLVGRTALSTFDVMKAVALLVQAELVELADRPRLSASQGAVAAPTAPSFLRRHPSLVRSVLHLAASLLISLALLAAGVHLYMSRGHAPEAGERHRLETALSPLRDLRTATHLERLRAVLQAYRLEQGGYPPTLAALIDAGQLAPADLRWPSYRETYYYRPTAEGFVLLPPKR